MINAMIRDGRTYADIIREVGDDADLNEQNLTNWKEGGHIDWLKDQERLADMRAKREFALQVVQENEGSKLHEASMQLAGAQIYEALLDFDLSALKVRMVEKPEEFSNLVSALAKLSKGTLEVEKYKEQVRVRKEAIEKELGKAKNSGELTKETIERIEEQLKLL